jgi:hypothetical protein
MPKRPDASSPGTTSNAPGFYHAYDSEGCEGAVGLRYSRKPLNSLGSHFNWRQPSDGGTIHQVHRGLF